MPHVLIVEDDAPLAWILTAMLEDALGCTTVVAPDGAAAWQALHTARFDLILLDRDPPDRRRLARYRQCFTALASQATPLLLVSTVAPQPEATGPPGVRYLRKPFGLAELVREASALLERSDHPTAPAWPAERLTAHGRGCAIAAGD